MYLAQVIAKLLSWQFIQPVDEWLLTKINNRWTNEWLDAICPLVRETQFWMPVYLFLLVFILLNFGMRGIWWSVGVILVAAISDIVSSQIIKQLIFRIRPCHEAELSGQIRFIINYCPKSSSFTSSHATTHFAQALYFYLTLRHTSRWWSIAFIWAMIIAFAQVYVGVHYPFDVFCGAIIGCLIGWLVSKYFHRHIGML